MPKFKTNLRPLMLQKSVALGYSLTQKEVAEATGLSVPTIARWYQGEVDRIEITTVAPLINYLGCDFQELVQYEAD